MMAKKTDFNQVLEQPNFPQDEERILKFWDQINAFKKQLELTKDCPPFTFYDGPPFATGLPHYGHITAGTIKDVICRYFSQNGRYVERRFGWDCHGLPVEFEIDKALGIKQRGDVFKMGIDKYNDECRKIVMRYSKEWEETVSRCGRWIDFENDYKTLYPSFMESIWWVFKQIWDRGLVYRGCRVMPYSNGCNTVLSNFETQQNYQETLDPSLFVMFPWVSDPDTKFVAWTTTPWTLPSNLALAVNPTFDYVKVLDSEHKTHFVIAECRLSELYPKGKDKYKVVQKMKGQELVGTEYVPLFNYFLERKEDGCFRVIIGDFVTDDAGTGVVHCAPGFGAEDYKACVKQGLIKPDDPPVPVDDQGCFTEKISDYKGMYIKDADKEIRKALKQNNRMLIDSQVRHNYPFCWRSDTPLIYKAVHCWFIKVTDIKDQLLENNKKAYWVPTFAQEGRFHKWLENAEDWCFSRNRFWGNPIPIWVSDDYEEQVCVGSIEELRQLSGVQDIHDLHREHIDKITIPSKMGKGQLKRIDELFDCWFESGSMPYAQQHYPFTMKEDQFQKIFPADFIAEGIDQTRGWFYTLNVISTAIRNDTPYKNLIVNGLVLNEDGKKMSKRKKNYPDPSIIIDTYSADAMRLYLMKSGLVKGETLNFKEAGVKAVVRDIFLPWYNAYRFLIQNISRYEQSVELKFNYDENVAFNQQNENLMDKWIVSSSQTLIKFVREQMEAYHLDTVAPKLLEFLEQLTNWYVRLNRPRLKGELGNEQWVQSLNVLFDVLFKVSILLSPFVPFITDSMYQNLKKCIQDEKYNKDSIHFLNIPQYKQEIMDAKIEQDVLNMQNVIVKARILREKHKINLKQPITSLTIITTDETFIKSLTILQSYVKEEVNTPQLIFEQNVAKYVELKCEPDNKVCGKDLGENFSKDFISQIATLQKEGSLVLRVKIQREKKVANEEMQQEQQKKGGKKQKQKKEFEELEVDVQLLMKHVIVKEQYITENLPDYQVFSPEENYSLLLDSRQDEKLRYQGLAREFTNRVQKLRKAAGLNVEDKIVIFYEFVNSETLEAAVNAEYQQILQQIKKPIFPFKRFNPFLKLVKNGTQKDIAIEEYKINLYIAYDSIMFDDNALNQKYGDKVGEVLKKTIGQYPVDEVKKIVDQNLNIFKVSLDGKEYQLKLAEDFYFSATDAIKN